MEWWEWALLVVFGAWFLLMLGGTLWGIKTNRDNEEWAHKQRVSQRLAEIMEEEGDE